MFKYKIYYLLPIFLLSQVVISTDVFAVLAESESQTISIEPVIKPDYEREKRWAAEVLPGIFIGDPVFLKQKNQHNFLGILSEPDDTRMAVVIVHGMGVHPDWGLISTIRQQLYEYDYTTLSIQMPVLAADAPYKDYTQLFSDASERIKMAVDYLKKSSNQRVAIVSHSNGSRMSRVYAIENQSDIDAWVALSLTQGDTFEGISVPVFDVYGEQDLPHVLATANKRKTSLKDNAGSIQIVIPNTDHFFNGQVDLLTLKIKEFLDSRQ